MQIDIKASNPAWNKWLPSWPTSAHWYDKSRFRRYMAAHIANRGNITVREFISEFRGMTGTAKQKVVLAETGASHVSLHNFFGLHKANTDNIAKLLASLKKHTQAGAARRAWRHRQGSLLSPHGGGGRRSEDIHLQSKLGETAGVPRVIEFAFGIHRDGLMRRTRAEPESYHRRQLVARYQQSIPATRARWRRPRWNLVGSPRQHIAAGHRRAAHGLSARRIHRPGQVGNRG